MENLKRCFKKIYDRNVMLENDNKTHKQIIKELLDVNKVLSSKNQNLEREFGWAIFVDIFVKKITIIYT